MASNGKFSLTELLNGTSVHSEEKPSTGAAQETPSHMPLKVVPISVHDLIPSKGNFYNVENLAELKNSIEMFGVLQNLTVKPTENGKYEILAGHRRHRVCMELVAKGKTEYEYVPCGIQGERNEIKERILLIMTNSTARELSDWEKMTQAVELQKCFLELKQQENLQGRVRDLVAEALNTSTGQIARMNAISNNLTAELTEEFKAGRLGLSVAYELSGLSEEKQQEALVDYQAKGGLTISEAKERKQDTPPPTAEAVEPKETPERDSEEISNGFTAPNATEEPQFEPMDYPETPNYEDEQDGESETKKQDFADFNETEKAEAAIEFLNRKRFALFAPGEDTRIFDYILETLERVNGE